MKKTTARNLRRGDVLAGSGFTVTHDAYAGVHTPKGKVEIEGFYPKAGAKRYTWNASTTVIVSEPK